MLFRSGDDFISLPKGTDLGTIDLNKAIEQIKAKQKADAPVGTFQNKPITKGTGRFGPFIKWDGIFINVSRKYDFANLSAADMKELIEAKIKKEENRYIHRWPEEKIALENGRWGPMIRFGKKMIYLPKKKDGSRVSATEASDLTLEKIKEIIETQFPGSFTKKKAAAAKKPTKKVVKKAAKKK